MLDKVEQGSQYEVAKHTYGGFLMSTSLIYHAFGATSYKYLSTEYKEGTIYFHVEKKKDRQRCVSCKHRRVTREGKEEYTLRALPIGKKPVFLVLHLHYLQCKNCGKILQESRDVADPRKSYTRPFARYVIELSKEMTMHAIADHLKVGWGVVKSIIKENLQRKAKYRSWSSVRRIAIDEIAIKKGHTYMTVVLDLDSGLILYTAEGKDHSALEAFFRRLKKAKADLEAVAVDMSEAFNKAITKYWPHKVAIVHDHYHIVSNMNAVIDKVRRDEQKRLEDDGKTTIKGSRYLLLRSKETIEKMPEKKIKLDRLLEENKLLHQVYLLKEELRMFWKQDSKDDAKSFIKNWISEAKSVGNKHVKTFAATIEKRIDCILSWYDHSITTGPLEGINNKIKVMKRTAYGFNDSNFFGLRILFIHESELKMSGV